MKNNYLAITLRVVANLTAWIAGPIIIGVFVGKWLDNHFHTEPLLFVITIGLCFLISIYGLVINAQREFKKIEIEAQQEKKDKAEKENKLNDEKK